MTSYFTHLECWECSRIFAARNLNTFCPDCNAPLFASYGLCHLSQAITPQEISSRPRGIWRWEELLPVLQPVSQLSLGEGDTPMVHLKNIGHQLGVDQVFVKDESRNASASFKARGLCVAVSKARELGIRVIGLPTAGNAGGALAAYATHAGLEAHVFMPKQSPQANRSEVIDFGAHLHLVDGDIHQAGKLCQSECNQNSWFNLATFREPYRVEGKKTLGFEITEFFDWQLPDWIIYPTGGGTGIVGMYKAFLELREMGWILDRFPRFAAVQSTGCAPLVKAFRENNVQVDDWQSPSTIATGLNIPSMFAGKAVLKILRQNQGLALSVSENEIVKAQDEFNRKEGILASPEGAATLAGFAKLLKKGMIKHSQRVVLFNTASGLKYL